MNQFFINLLFPPTCFLCGKHQNECICTSCYQKIEPLLVFSNDIYQETYFENHLAVCPYKGIIRTILLEYKFHQKSYWNEFFVKIIVKNKKICQFLKSYDIIVPVPIHKKRKAQRGYNQSELIAKKLARQLEIGFEPKILKKKKHTVPQSTLNREERIKNAKEVYCIQKIETIRGKNIILFDDIYTTGATAMECAKILKENGCHKILVLTLAKD